MERGTNTLIGIAVLAIIIVLAVLFFGLYTPSTYQTFFPNLTFNQTSPVLNHTTTVFTQLNSTYLLNYTLGLINNDRAKYGLEPVSLSPEPSGQQHAESMLQNQYFSHWDIYGMKPYMRYTLEGGRGAVDENVAYQTSQECNLLGSCSGRLNVTQAIAHMEYSMMYNDTVCCANGHRDNILDQNHNEVSIGLAYNSSTIYLVEDFIDDYINWYDGTPSYSDGQVSLMGKISGARSISSIEISYDPLVQSMSTAQLDKTGPYSYGQTVAGVVQSAQLYYPNLTTVVASKYSVAQSTFDIEFNMSKVVSEHGAGEYTIGMWLSSNSIEPASTYTIFINSSGEAYQPSNI